MIEEKENCKSRGGEGRGGAPGHRTGADAAHITAGRRQSVWVEFYALICRKINSRERVEV